MNDNISEILSKEIVSCIKLLRIIYKDLNNDIYKSLGKPFQKSVSGLIKMIPSEWLHGCLNCYLMLKGMIQCVDFNKLAKVLHKHCATAWDNINSKEFVIECMRGYCTEAIEYEKAAETILSNFNPIFNAVDYIFGHELVFIDRLAEIYKMKNECDPLLS